MKKKTKKPRGINIIDDNGRSQIFMCGKRHDEKAILNIYNYWITKTEAKRLAKWFAQAVKWLEEGK